MPHRTTAAVTTVLLSLLLACGDAGPTEPAAFDPPGTHQAPLRQLGGDGRGGVSVTPQAVTEGYFTAVIRIRLVGAKPNTQYTVQRAPEVGRPQSADGSCQRALGISPWSSADPPIAAFLTFTQSGSTTPVTLLTSATGDASVDFSFSAPTIPAGTRFDVMFRILDDLAVPTSLFMSNCFTVIVL